MRTAAATPAAGDPRPGPALLRATAQQHDPSRGAAALRDRLVACSGSGATVDVSVLAVRILP